MEKPLLRDPSILPGENVLREVLGDSFPTYGELVNRLSDCSFEWKFYRDGGAWLCKVVFQKKTVFWLSVWDGYFKLSFYFCERHVPDVMILDIPERNKIEFREHRGVGKLIPLAFEIRDQSLMEGLMQVIEYRKQAK